MAAAAFGALMLSAAPTLAQEATPVASATEAAAPRGLSLRDLAMMERVSEPRVSPDGRRILYAVRTTDWDGNKGVNSLWLADAAGGEPRKLAISEGGVSGARWAPDGGAIYFLSSRGGSNQVWRADVAGMAAAQVTTLPFDVSGFRIAPDGRSLVLAVSVFVDCDTLACTKIRLDARGKSTIQSYDRLPLRDFDHWVDTRRTHLFVLPLNGSGLGGGEPRDLMTGLDADVSAGDSSFDISPDGRTLVYGTQTQGAGEPFTSNSDVFRVALDGGAPVNLTEANTGPDGNPVFSPDGRRLAWLSAPRENVGGDQAAVWTANADGAGAKKLTDWDRGAGGLQWRTDGRALLVSAADEGQNRLFSVDARSGRVTPLTGSGTVGSYEEVAGVLAYAHESFVAPTQIFVQTGGEPRQVTHHNAEVLAQLDLPKGEAFTFAGWNGEPVQGWVFKPAGAVEGRRYPAVYLIHGGPKSPWTESFSYRWNPQVYTAAGYAVVMINFHGSPGYGQAFTDAINDHWGDRPLEDLEKGWTAALMNNPWIDGDRACALGASYGGYMVNMIAGKWNGPWRCLVNHAGVFDVPQLMNAMDIGNFIHEFGGPSWERKAVYDAFNPETYVGDWSKPMLVLHGSKDFRVPMEQGLATFSALQREGIPSRFVHVPDENHWVLKPRTWVDWQQEILDWVGRYTAPEG
jgi:acylaminoacyl-peptidase